MTNYLFVDTRIEDCRGVPLPAGKQRLPVAPRFHSFFDAFVVTSENPFELARDLTRKRFAAGCQILISIELPQHGFTSARQVQGFSCLEKSKCQLQIATETYSFERFGVRHENYPNA